MPLKCSILYIWGQQMKDNKHFGLRQKMLVSTIKPEWCYDVNNISCAELWIVFYNGL